MNKIKSLGIMALGALTFTFMSFSSSSDDMYTTTYSSNTENLTAERLAPAIFPTIITTLAAATKAAAAAAATAGTKAAAVSAAKAVGAASAVASAGFVGELGIQGAQALTRYASHVDTHSKNYTKAIDILKDQQIRKLG